MTPSLEVHREWLEQAARDLEAARHLLTGGYYEWAAYAARQGAEKALKALRMALGTEIAEIKVHDLVKIAGTLLTRAPDPRLHELAQLEAHDQGARYPGLRGKAGLAPFKTYDQPTAAKIIDVANGIVDYATELVPEVEAFWTGRPKAASP